jgi:hypothetical protein
MSEPKKPSRVKNLSYASIAGFAGCWIMVMVMAALFAGLWLDAQFGRRGPFTVGLVALSVPITLFVTVRIVLRLVESIQPPPKKNEADSDSSNEGGSL